MLLDRNDDGRRPAVVLRDTWAAAAPHGEGMFAGCVCVLTNVGNGPECLRRVRVSSGALVPAAC
jgi:hypothetical protein